MDLHKYQLVWKGMSGGPGVSTFYFDAASAIPHTAMTTFVNALKTSVAATVTVQFPGSGITIDDATGNAVGSWTAAAPADVAMTSAGSYSSPVGAVINWRTGVYAGGRELRGKTFVVPLAAATMTSGGILSAATQSGIAAAANALAGSAVPPRVFSRANHTSAPVASATVPTLPAVLTSRRD